MNRLTIDHFYLNHINFKKCGYILLCCCWNKGPSFFFSIRFLLAFLTFLGVAVQYMQKIDMGIGIVCMINNTALEAEINHRRFYYVADYYTQNTTDNCYFQPGNQTTVSLLSKSHCFNYYFLLIVLLLAKIKIN